MKEDIPQPAERPHSSVSDGIMTHAGSTESIVDYPDGGLRAWLVVFGAWCAMIPSMGLLNSLAVLQAWLGEHELQGMPESSTGWIFSGYAFFLFFCGAQIGPVFDAHDMRLLIIPGAVGIVLALVFMSLSSEFYQFFLSFSVLGGISSSLLYNPAVSAIGHWFHKKRGLATGLACTAGGVGGVWMPLVILYLAPRIGFGWSIRVIALMCAIHGAAACCLLTKRLKPEKSRGSSIDIKALKDIDYAAVALGLVLVEFAVFIPITYICSYGIHAGFGYLDAYMLNPLLNVGAVPGRFLPNYVADRFGVMNTMCAITFCCMASIFGLWLTANGSQAMTTAFAIIYGFWSGASNIYQPSRNARVMFLSNRAPAKPLPRFQTNTPLDSTFDKDIRDVHLIYDYDAEDENGNPEKWRYEMWFFSEDRVVYAIHGGPMAGRINYQAATYQCIRPGELWQVNWLEETGTVCSLVYDIPNQKISTLISFSRGHWENPQAAHGDKRNPGDLARWRVLARFGHQSDRLMLSEQADIVEKFKGKGNLVPISEDAITF
ncbi:MFS transporter asaE [Colletotrichum siamense]|nr:MFS transporter asaE [Colletotrichum siamense]KAF4845264.1 MFS transporter asaE [Colletotrichum siamense]KAF4860913.1 MFS transporter asaE [Colletotrichum siamense]KAF5484387.1 MFS transporter asaE [Colletotrichum siamense]